MELPVSPDATETAQDLCTVTGLSAQLEANIVGVVTSTDGLCFASSTIVVTAFNTVTGAVVTALQCDTVVTSVGSGVNNLSVTEVDIGTTLEIDVA